MELGGAAVCRIKDDGGGGREGDAIRLGAVVCGRAKAVGGREGGFRGYPRHYRHYLTPL